MCSKSFTALGVSTLYTGIKQGPSLRELLGSSKYTIVFVYVVYYANSDHKRTYYCTIVSLNGDCSDNNDCTE
ncbi:hypothetical protein T08_5499 [Trichinella sp. T8]|nr:hypothetical protein T08_5499 [Trichinella sp. T8]